MVSLFGSGCWNFLIHLVYFLTIAWFLLINCTISRTSILIKYIILIIINWLCYYRFSSYFCKVFLLKRLLSNKSTLNPNSLTFRLTWIWFLTVFLTLCYYLLVLYIVIYYIELRILLLFISIMITFSTICVLLWLIFSNKFIFTAIFC